MRVCRFIGFASLLLVLVAAGPTFAEDVGAGDLRRALGKALEAKAFKKAKVGAVVLRRSDGEVLFERNAGLALTPASNQKLLTSAAALAHFGPTYHFPTAVYVDMAPDDSGSVETLFLRGTGDPSLVAEDYWRLAADLYRKGLREVRGELVLDDSAFDRMYWNPNWRGISARAYHAPVSALNANYGSFSVTVRPDFERGNILSVSIDPPLDMFTLRNQGRSGKPAGRTSLSVIRQRGGDTEVVGVTGRLPAGGDERTFYRSVADPVRYAGEVFRMQLEAVGIRVVGENRVGVVPEEAEEFLVFEGKSLAEIVRLFMKYSNNLMGEALVKAMGNHATGDPGSWENGLPVLKQELAGLGLDVGEFNVVDGSGLSYENRVAPRTLAQLLRIADRSFKFGPEFQAALPIAGADGTLQRRAVNATGFIRAKTGLLNQVSALSGYATTQEGEQLVFSIIVNGHRRGDGEIMYAIDRFATAMTGVE